MATKTKNCEYKMTIENALKQLKKLKKPFLPIKRY